MERFDMDGQSFLRWAQDNDIDRYEAAQEAGKLTKGSGTIQTYEWSQENSQLNTLITLVDKLVHVTAQKGASKNKRKNWKPPKLDWPRTAVEGLRDRMRVAREQATASFMSRIEFVPEAEYLAEAAENEAAERALAAADQAESDDS